MAQIIPQIPTLPPGLRLPTLTLSSPLQPGLDQSYLKSDLANDFLRELLEMGHLTTDTSLGRELHEAVKLYEYVMLHQNESITVADVPKITSKIIYDLNNK